MNKVILVGRLTRDPEVRYTPSGVAQARFTIAVDRPYAKRNAQNDPQSTQQTADFIPITAWRERAQTIGNYFHKGMRILVEGKLQVSNYTAQDGTKKTYTDVMLDNFEFLDSKRDVSSESQRTPQDSNRNLIESPQDFPNDGDDVPPEQIPF